MVSDLHLFVSSYLFVPLHLFEQGLKLLIEGAMSGDQRTSASAKELHSVEVQSSGASNPIDSLFDAAAKSNLPLLR